MRTSIQYAVAGVAGHWLLSGLLSTVRFEARGNDVVERLRAEGKPHIIVAWHGRLLPLAYLHRGRGIVALVSRSRDGEYITRVLEHWGYLTSRGSSSRGGAEALRELLYHARAGRTIAFTPDGPRGPRQKMKPGALVAAQRTGLPIVPMAAGTDRAWWFESWDRFMVPKPFSRVRVAYGEPVTIPRDLSAEEVEAAGAALEATLNGLLEEVDRGWDRR